MFVLKACEIKRRRGIGLALIGASFAIQMVPPILHAWARVLGVGEGQAMAGIAIVYLALLAFVLRKGRGGPGAG
jgi:hypothetical protein